MTPVTHGVSRSWKVDVCEEKYKKQNGQGIQQNAWKKRRISNDFWSRSAVIEKAFSLKKGILLSS